METALDSFTPSPGDIKFNNIRRIFAHVPLDPDEEMIMNEVRALMAKKGMEKPDWLDDHRRILLRLIECGHRKPKKVLKFIEQYAEWRTRQLPVPREEVAAPIDAGCFYVHGRDRQFRPIVILDVRKLMQMGLTPEQTLRLNYFLLEWVVEHLLRPGKVETWDIIMDLSDVPLKEIPMKPLKTMMKSLTVFYCCCLFKTYILNPAPVINTLWKIVQFFLDSQTRQKIRFVMGADKSELQELIDPSQLEVKYGGSHPNLEAPYFPPRLL